MSTEIISLSSSDEEDNINSPPLKKPKTLNLTECTLSVVTVKSIKNPQPEISVVIDSDEESDEKLYGEVTNCDSQVENKNDVDLITLTDDENDEYMQDVSKSRSKINNNSESNCNKTDINCDNTVSIIDTDSDSGTLSTKNCDTSIMINDSDDEIEKQNGESNNKECDQVEISNNENNIFGKEDNDNLSNVDISKTSVENGEEKGEREFRPSTSQVKTLKINGLFKEFLQLIEDKITGSKFEQLLPEKMPVIQKYFNKCEAYVKERDFYQLLSSCIDEINKSSIASAANCAVISFHKVCKELRSHICQTTVEIEEAHVEKVKRLEKAIHLLSTKIKQLEETEVDFEADNNSSYIQLDRYQLRLNKVYKKYCCYIKRNPYIGRPVYDRITFVSSNCNIINQALTKKYKNSLNFPSYYELRKYIQDVVDEHKLDLTDDDITIESKKCFKSLGSILQKKRRQELYDSHLAYIETSEDPAKKDVLLENALKKSQKEGEEKIRELCQRFVDLADRGEDHISSEPSSSNESESEEDEEQRDRSHKVKKKEEENGKEKDEKKSVVPDDNCSPCS